MKHPTSCERATNPLCRCGGCAGTLHGWPGTLELIREPRSRESLRHNSERAWNAAEESLSRRRPTNRLRRAAISTAKSSIVDWLAGSVADPSDSAASIETELLATAGEALSKAVFDALCGALEASNSRERRAKLAEDHFFCALLAGISCSMQEIQEYFDQAVRDVATALASYSILDNKTTRTTETLVAAVVAEAAVKCVNKMIENLTAVQQFKHLQQALQVLALMSCPAPEKHPGVQTCALKPLGEPLVSELVQERLKLALPDWNR